MPEEQYTYFISLVPVISEVLNTKFDTLEEALPYLAKMKKDNPKYKLYKATLTMEEVDLP